MPGGSKTIAAVIPKHPALWPISLLCFGIHRGMLDEVRRLGEVDAGFRCCIVSSEASSTKTGKQRLKVIARALTIARWLLNQRGGVPSDPRPSAALAGHRTVRPERRRMCFRGHYPTPAVDLGRQQRAALRDGSCDGGDAWPWSAQLPTTEPAVFFLVAAIWFVTIAVVGAQTTARRVLYGYHGLMMLATAWMYAIMNGDLLPLQSMNMPRSGGAPVWFTAVGWFGTLSFAAAAVFWTYRYFVERHSEATRRRSLGSLCQAMMATGTTIFFLATLFSI